MISLQRGLEDYKELCSIISGVKDINMLVALISDNPRYNITNDLRNTDGVIDVNFKSICATIKQCSKYLSVLPDIEVWDEDGRLNFANVNIYAYSKYDWEIREDGRVQITSSHPYDEQKYHYAIGNNIYRDGKFVEKIEESKDSFMDGLDEIVLRLIVLDRPLKSIICNN